MTENEAADSDVAQQTNVISETGDDKLSSPEVGMSKTPQNRSGPPSPRMLQLQENDSHSKSGSRSLFKWKSDSEALLPKELTKDVTSIR